MSKISPPPERILWLYKRWQPLYDIIKSTVYPSVEFIQGIPLDLEQDSFVHPGTRNLVILDDLMSTAAKDSRINELFTEGSHHRNLSVMAINQNLYYNKDPTQRRNCHYLVLFNNPVDRQQVMTLARQMYPNNPQHLLRHFKEASSKPYEYLLVDLKPTTSEHLRMRIDVLNPIKQLEAENVPHSPRDIPTEQTYHQPSPLPQQLLTEKSEFQHTTPDFEDMPSCDDCGLVFENMHDLQRHVKRWCPENEKRRDDVEMEEDQSDWTPIKPEKKEDEDDREHDVINALMDTAREKNETEWNQKYNKYIKEGLTREKAREKTEAKMKSKDLQTFVTGYADLIQYILDLKHGSIHATIMDDVSDFQSRCYGERKSIRMALNKNRHLLDEMWDDEMEFDERDSETEEEDSDESEEA